MKSENSTIDKRFNHCAVNLLFRLLKLWIRVQFPTVRSLSTQDLDRWLQDPDKTPPILLDVRTVPEFKVSHLKTAQRTDPKDPNIQTAETLL
ncbi:hypothetical protein IQ250_25150 [Pseudanabaenaceae cyanobacterium LEGE 13415]|nr:hypothetical protein [Pseudanabaenaceae cyanobacterium LEGE 13415]